MKSLKCGGIAASLTLAFFLGLVRPATATNYYWDSNSTTLGAGDTPTGTWGTSTFWNTVASGGSGGSFTSTTGSSDDANFVAGPAGNSGENSFAITISGTQNAHSLAFQSAGAASFSGSGTIDLWAGGINIPQNAYGTTPQGQVTISSALALQAAQTWTNSSASALTIAGNIANGGNMLTISGVGDTTYSGVMSGTGALTKAGSGTLNITGTNTFSGGITVNGGTLKVLSSGALTMSSGQKLNVGNTAPGIMRIQDLGSVTASEFDVNYQATSTSASSSLTITGGSLSVSGQSYIGRAATHADTSTITAAVYQSGGTATLSGSATIGYNGTTTSIYDIDGGTLNANAGLLVGGNSGNGNSGQGNGVLSIHGAGTVNVSGGSGLLIGQDINRTTSGTVSLASGTLAVTGNTTIGSGGGSGIFSRSGGSFSASGNLSIAGNATITLDATIGSVATSFGGSLSHAGSGTMTVVPVTGTLDTTEALSFASNPLPSGASMIGAWTVRETSGTNSAGDYLTSAGSGPYRLTTASYGSTNFSGATSSSLVNVSGTPTVSSSTTVSAVKVSGTATISSGQTLTLGSGGLILNGGTVTGGSLAFGATPLIFAGSTSPGTIGSQIQSSAGLVKFGPATLIVSADNSNSLSNAVLINGGTLNARNAGALGAGGSGSPVVVAQGSALELQNSIAIGNVPVTLNGAGPIGGGSLRNVQDSNSLGGSVTLGSNSQINTVAGTLTLSGSIQGGYTLTKRGTGTLVLSGSSGSAFPSSVVVNQGVLRVQNANGLGSGGGLVTASITNGAALQLQNGIAVPNVLLTIAGTGVGNGVIENVSGSDSAAGAITLSGDSQVNVDSASDTLTLSGVIGGGFALTKGGPGTLVLSGANTFTEAINVINGTLSVASVNNTGSAGPLGAGTAPVVLGSSSAPGSLLYTGTSAGTTNRNFTLAGSGCQFPVTTNLTLNGVIDGSGGLLKTGTGTLTLGGLNLLNGTVTVSTSTLAVSNSGSINGVTGILIGPAGMMQVTAGSSVPDQLPDTGNVSLTGGSLSYIDNGAVNPGELAGALILNPGQNNITLSNSGSGGPYLRFASAPLSHTTGATVNFSATNGSIQFQTNPLPLTNGIIGGFAFTSDASFTTVDFATLGSSSPYTVQAYSGYTTGDLGSLATSGSTNVAPSGSQTTISASKTFNSLKLTGSIGVTIGSGNTLSLNSGGIIANTSGTISGGTLSAPNGEMIVNAVQHLTVSSAITASSAFVKTGSATLTLSSATAITGGTYLNQGTLEYAPSSDLTYAGAISGAGNLLKSGSTVLTLSGTNSYTGSTTVTGGALRVNGSLGAGTTVSLQGAALTGSGTVNGPVTVTSSGGTIAMSSGANIVGQVSDSSGALTVGQTGGSNYLNTTGGLSVSGTGTLVANTSSSTITGSLNYTSSANSTFAGVIAGSGTVTMGSSSGTALTLSGSNTYSGGTVVGSGTLKAANSSAFGSGGLTVNGGLVDLNGYNETITALTGSGGTIETTTGTSTLTVNLGTSIFDSFSGNIAGTGSSGQGLLALLKSGNGTLTIGGTNTYLGGTTISAGTLIVRGALPVGDSVSIGSGATLEIAPTDASGNPLFGESFSQPASFDSMHFGGSASVPEPGAFVLTFIAAGIVALFRLRARILR